MSLFVIQPESGDVFQPRMLGLIRSLTEDAWQIPHSTRVDGITNFQHTWADGDDLIVEDLVGDGDITPALTGARPSCGAHRTSPRRTPGIERRWNGRGQCPHLASGGLEE